MLNFYNDIASLIISEFNIKNPTQFCQMLELNPTNIGSWKRGSLPNLDIIGRILHLFPTLSPEWLITGKGEMYRSQEKKPQTNTEIIEYLKEEIIRERKISDELREEKGKMEQKILDLESQVAVFFQEHTVK
jgi:hypothetical protein